MFWIVIYQVSGFRVDLKFKVVTIGGQFTIRSYEKNILKLFSSETTKTFERKLGGNVPWLAPYNMSIVSIKIQDGHHGRRTIYMRKLTKS